MLVETCARPGQHKSCLREYQFFTSGIYKREARRNENLHSQYENLLYTPSRIINLSDAV